MGYDRIKKKHRVESDKPSITIGKKGAVYLNAHLLKNQFKDVRNVALHFDEERTCLAIEPLKAPDENSFCLSYSSNRSKSTGIISARSHILKIVKEAGLNLKDSAMFAAKWNSEEQFLEIELKRTRKDV